MNYLLKIVFIAIILLLSCKCFPNTDSLYINNLAITCKVWGILKYYGNKTTNGSINWDTELINTLSEIENVKNQHEFNKIINGLILKVGFGKKEMGNSNEENLFEKNYRLALDSSNLSMLKRIIDNYYPHRNYYAYNKNYYLKNEIPYSDSIFPGKACRILALFRFWNVIKFFYPYENHTGNMWDSVLMQYIHRFINCKDTLDYHLAVVELAKELHDNHLSYVYSKILHNHIYKDYYYPPLIVDFVENKTIIRDLKSDSLNDFNQVKPGDIILKINNKPIEQYRKKLYKYTAAAETRIIERNLNHFLFAGRRGTKVSITVERENEVIDINLIRNCKGMRELLAKSMFPLSLIINDTVLYLNLCRISDVKKEKKLLKMIKMYPVLVLDIRGHINYYPNKIIKALANGKRINTMIVKKPTIKHPGYFSVTEITVKGKKRNNIFPKTIKVLIDENTQSSSELTAIKLKELGATLIGSETAGVPGLMCFITLPGNIRIAYTGTVYYPPTQSNAVKIPIKPDIYKASKISDYKKDEKKQIKRFIY